MNSLLRRARVRGARLLFPVIFRTDVQEPLLRLGSAYGGWWVAPGRLSSESICYLAGVGTDVTFDVALMERFGCQVWGLDPTPRTVAWIATQALPPSYIFLAKGLAGSVSTLRFYAPRDPAHVSHSITNLQSTSTWFDADCTTVAALLAENGHDRLDLLKMDIEGAQHDVIDSLLQDGIRPGILCVEFDQPEPLSVTRRSVQKLRDAGYDLAKVEDFNMTFLLRC